MPHITIYLPETDLEALKKLALQELRTPREQALVIVLAGLKQQGLLNPGLETEIEAANRAS